MYNGTTIMYNGTNIMYNGTNIMYNGNNIMYNGTPTVTYLSHVGAFIFFRLHQGSPTCIKNYLQKL